LTAKYPIFNAIKLDRRLRELGCELIRKTGSHRHYSNPLNNEQLITFSEHKGDVPRGIVEDVIKDLGITKEQFFNPKFGLKKSK
jgi:predicted RNA binding protein YcfA (HicA-like mRNA interferase family)